MIAAPTKKLYYDDGRLLRATARVLEVSDDAVVVDRTIFYPEGGGQEGDRGWLGPLRVRDTQKTGGAPAGRADLPDVHINTVIRHYIEAGSAGSVVPGDEVELRVDAARRERLTRLHSAAHLALGWLDEKFGAGACITAGCHIAEDRARLDLRTEQKLGGDVLRELQEGVNRWVDTNAAVTMVPVDGVDEMFLWHCDISPVLHMPCGGTHVAHLGEVGHVTLKRKREGKGLERLYISLVGAASPDP